MIIVSFGLSSTLFAASEEDHQVTGTVVKAPDGTIAIEQKNNELFFFKWDTDIPKVGEKVTVHYDIVGPPNRARVVAHKVERVGEGEKGFKKR
jgi:hypothetical protein